MEWLNKTFLATVIQGGDHQEPRVTVINFSAKPAVSAGDNYNSHLYRVLVQYKDGQSSEKAISLIVKVPLTEGFFTETSGPNETEELQFFCLEPKIYNEYLPKANEKVHYEFGPKTFYCPIKNGLILEDLREAGFVMWDKHKQLDSAHYKQVMITLAKYHASSVACYRENSDLIKTVGQEFLYAEGRPMAATLKPWLKYAIKAIAGTAIEMSGFQDISALILSRVDHIWESVTKMCKPKVGGFNVLNHGDLWVNNILFKHSESGEVIGVKFLDYQIPRFMSPVTDLLFLMWSSASEDILENKQQDMYDLYLQTLNRTLEELKCVERLTAKELREDLKAAADWALVTLCYERPLMLALPEEAINMEKMNAEVFKTGEMNEELQKVYNGKHHKRLLPCGLRVFKALFYS